MSAGLLILHQKKKSPRETKLAKRNPQWHIWLCYIHSFPNRLCFETFSYPFFNYITPQLCKLIRKQVRGILWDTSFDINMKFYFSMSPCLFCRNVWTQSSLFWDSLFLVLPNIKTLAWNQLHCYSTMTRVMWASIFQSTNAFHHTITEIMITKKSTNRIKHTVPTQSFSTC